MTSTPMESTIYLDHHATTPVDPRVIGVISDTLANTFGNPNSIDHAFGTSAQQVVDVAREQVSALIGTEAVGVQFTSGSSEALALALRHAQAAQTHRPLRIASTPIEHRALLDLLAEGEANGTILVRWLRVDRQARLDLSDLEDALREVDLACVMSGNNEVGTLNPIEHISSLARAAGRPLLVDATQTAGREPLRMDDWAITYLVLSAHKMYGPKGVGALAVSPTARRRAPEALKRHGTPNVPMIAGMGEAARLRLLEMATDEPRIRGLRDVLQRRLLELIPGLVVNGDVTCRLSHNLHVSVPGLPNDAVTSRLHDQVAISTGAACTSGAQTPSHVLRAIGLPAALQEGALRLSPGKFTTTDEIERAALLIAQAVAEVRLLFGVPA